MSSKPAESLSNVQTPTGMTHLGRLSRNPWTKEQALMPACQKSSASLRYAFPTDAAVTCKRCLNTIREQDKAMTTRKSTQAAQTSAPRQTQRGVAKAATARKQTDKNAAQVRSINTAQQAAEQTVAEKIAEAVSEVKSARAGASDAPKPIRSAQKSTKDATAIEIAAKRLAEVETALKSEKDEAKRGLLTAERDTLILKLIKLDAGYTFIAKTRGVATSTNRGLCRVLEGGKRI